MRLDPAGLDLAKKALAVGDESRFPVLGQESPHDCVRQPNKREVHPRVLHLEGLPELCRYRRQAFKMKNSWVDFPLVWLPYAVMGTLLTEDGEATLVTDR